MVQSIYYSSIIQVKYWHVMWARWIPIVGSQTISWDVRLFVRVWAFLHVGHKFRKRTHVLLDDAMYPHYSKVHIIWNKRWELYISTFISWCHHLLQHFVHRCALKAIFVVGAQHFVESRVTFVFLIENIVSWQVYNKCHLIGEIKQHSTTLAKN